MPSASVHRIQEAQTTTYHVLWELVQQALAVHPGLTAPARTRIRVAGIVQGVGFRPFVHALAAEFGLAGFVGNDETGVLIEAEGPPAALTGFVAALRDRPPALAVVTGVDVRPLTAVGDAAFTIAPSTAHGPRTTLVSPDTATCADCLRELRDPADRRHRYPFTNCTNCGPRFTIVTGVPYDRAATTMAPFPMCADCAREYADPADRRFHAQPVCCPACGPRLRWTGRGDASGRPDRRRGRRAAGRRRRRRQGPRRLPPRRPRRRRDRGRRAARAQAPGGQAVRRPGSRPRRRPMPWPRSTRSRSRR